MTEEQREAILRFDAARRAHPAWAKQIHDQLVATAMAALRGYPFSWTPTIDHV